MACTAPQPQPKRDAPGFYEAALVPDWLFGFRPFRIMDAGYMTEVEGREQATAEAAERTRQPGASRDDQAADKATRARTPSGHRAYGLINCGAAVGAADFQAAYLEGEGGRLCAEATCAIPRVTGYLLPASAHAMSIALYLSLQCRIDYLCQTHLPSRTWPL